MSAPKHFRNRDEITTVRAETEALENGVAAETKRRLAGRVLARRDMGKLVFLDLVDRSGRIQLLCHMEKTGDIDVHLGDVVGVTGSPSKSKRGEPSLDVDSLEILARIKTPLPDTFHGVTDVEARYRRRYLDLLMNEDSRRDAILRARMVTAMRGYLDAEGFIEVETPILQPRYGGGFAEPFVTTSNLLDQDLYLRIADELYLKRLIVGGLEKVYELSKDFRNESYSYMHSPEFTQVEPDLIQPTIVYDWPIELSPFARTTDDDESIVERFEVVVGGMEFANAFSELNDSEDQAQRFAAQAGERQAGDVEAEPGDPDYVEAMSYGMAPNSGIGIGIDRLAMVLLGRDTIRDVILFPLLREKR